MKTAISNGLRNVLRRCWQLFVDDGWLAAACLLWLGATSLSGLLSIAAAWRGGLLFAGLAGALLVSVLRVASARGQSAPPDQDNTA